MSAAAFRDPRPWLVALLVFWSLAGPVLVLSGYDLAALYVDDAFYYFEIASKVGSGHGLTFDGIHATNGFHPLWLLSAIYLAGIGARSSPAWHRRWQRRLAVGRRS